MRAQEARTQEMGELSITSMFVQEYRGTEGFRALQDEWEEIRGWTCRPHIFSTWEWLYNWRNCLSPEEDLVLLTVRDQNRALRGVGALSFHGGRTRTTVRFFGDINTCDYMDFLLQEGYEEPALRALLTYLNGELDSEDKLDLWGIPGFSPTIGLLPDLANSLGMEIESGVEEVAPVLDLPEDWESYLALLSRKDRHELRRKLRRIYREAQVEFRVVEEVEALTQEIPSFLELHGKSSPVKEDFMNQQMQEFFMALPKALGDRGWMVLYVLLLDGVKAASLLCFRYEGTIFAYNSGYDPRFSRLSPGLAVFARAIERAIEEGYRRFDFLRGQEDYKYRLGAVSQPIYRVQITKP